MDKNLTPSQIKEIILSITGRVMPIAKTEIDSLRLQNLKLLGKVLHLIWEEIEDIYYYHNNKPEASLNKASKLAYKILMDTSVDWVLDNRNAKVVLNDDNVESCSECGNEVKYTKIHNHTFKMDYCDRCGRLLDWSEV